MGLAAARGEGPRHAKNDDLLASAELRDVDLVSRVVFEQVHGGNGVTNCHWSHCGHVKLSAEIIEGSNDNLASNIHPIPECILK